jgi:hypothetical protein
VRRVCTYLQEQGLQVEAAFDLLIEMYAAPDAERALRVRALTTMASRFRQYPCGYELALEFIGELRRLRPSSVLANPDRDHATRQLRQFRKFGRDAIVAPGIRPLAFHADRERFEIGRAARDANQIQSRRTVHEQVRSLLIRSPRTLPHSGARRRDSRGLQRSATVPVLPDLPDGLVRILLTRRGSSPIWSSSSRKFSRQECHATT